MSFAQKPSAATASFTASAAQRPASQFTSSSTDSPSLFSDPLIVHSHLRWEWVWQRPQQFLSRLSKKRRVLFVEGPIPLSPVATPFATYRQLADFPNITVVQNFFPATRWHEGAWVDAERHRLLRELLSGPAGAPL